MLCVGSTMYLMWEMLMHGGEGSPGHHQGAKCVSLSIVLKGMEVGDGMIRSLYCVFNQGHRGWELGSWPLI